jgi:hypothetical protein
MDSSLDLCDISRMTEFEQATINIGRAQGYIACAQWLLSLGTMMATIYFYRKLVANDIKRTQREDEAEATSRARAAFKETSSASHHHVAINLGRKFPDNKIAIIEAYQEVTGCTNQKVVDFINEIQRWDPTWPIARDWVLYDLIRQDPS